MTRLPERPQPQLLNERLQRCDAAIAASDRAQRLRDQLLERHDRAAADAIAYGRALPATDPALNLAEIQLRSAKGAERAALMAREGIQAELQAINVQLGVVGQQIREQVCADMLPACALLCEGLERSLGVVAVDRAGFDSVADYLHRLAVTHANGGEVTATPEGRAEVAIRGLHAAVLARYGAHRVADFKTGEALHAAVSAGTAQLGDVSRFLLRQQPSAEPRVNLLEPGQEQPPPVEPGLPNAAVDPDGAYRAFWRNPADEERQRREAGVVEDTAPAWSSPFMPARHA